MIFKKYLKILFYFMSNIFEKNLGFIFKSKFQKTLIVIRTDAIGDYILFRNFLQPLYEKYGKLILVGNIAYQELALELDEKYIQEFIPIDRKKFVRNIFYRLKVIKKLRETSYATLINPIYSRDRVSEDIARIIDAKEKIASIGDNSNLPQKLKEVYDKNYTTLFPAKNEVMFEFYRNLEFFRHLISSDLEVDFCINISNPQEAISKFNLSSPYSVLFIGASAHFRKWSNDNFIQVARFLHSQYNENIVICGGGEDFINGEYIKAELQKSSISCTNLCGKTSLVDLEKIIFNTQLLISNETSAVHLAMAIGKCKVFVVSNGNHLYRFTPYPPQFHKNYHSIFHPLLHDTKNIKQYSGKTSTLNINDISAQDVINSINNHYKRKP